VNGIYVQEGLVRPGSIAVSRLGSFVDSAAKNTFDGSWNGLPAMMTGSETVFFRTPSGGISDVLKYSYSIRARSG
jgi:hypothetical protein